MASKTERHLFVVASKTTSFGESHANLAVTVCQQEYRNGEWAPRHESEGPEFGVSLSCQMGGVTGVDSYAWRIGIDLMASTFHPAEIEKTARALKAAQKMEKSVERCSAKYGRPATFGQFVAYATDALDIQGMMRVRPRGDESGCKFRTDGADMVTYCLDSLVTELAKACRGEDHSAAKAIAL